MMRTTWRTLYHLARADFLERTRRYSFLITIGLTIYLVYLYLPPIDASYLTLGLGHYRGVYNSAWVGSIVAVLCSTILSLPGFYLVKNAIERDQNTGVGQIIATTPVSRWGYVLGKTISNFVFLTVMVGVVMLAAMGMQLVRGESFHIELWAFVAPLVFTTLPVMALVASVAVLFETISWLRGGVGNVAYFLLLIAALIASFEGGSETGGHRATNEPFGATIITASMTRTTFELYPDYQGAFSIGVVAVEEPVQTFVWNGVQWTAQIALWRLFWLGTAVGLASVAALFFSRFDPARERRGLKRSERPEAADTETLSAAAPVHVPTRLTPLEAQKANEMALFGRMLLAELRLMLKGLPWWWYIVAVGLSIACLLAPVDVARQYIFPFAWIWPLLLWSAMGNREVRYRTNQLIFSAAHPLRRQLAAAWGAGLTVALTAAGGLSVRLILAGEWNALFAWCIGAAFIPSLALVLGIWSGGSKLFEVVYVLWWYAGPMNRVAFLDYMGATNDAVAMGVPLYCLAFTFLLLGLMVVGRRRQIKAPS
jgi:hypothetical protein